ncbi:MAG: hypothetical protein ABJF10_30215 [Chthoniobacter sp.]|uniref:hypothetical protein n=1 Tax=Chthoniobacter sp. TaxID=2510640 RepID=UPI0032AD0E78
MKTSKLLAIGACAAFAFTNTSVLLADEKKEHAEHAEKTAVPDTVDGIMAAIHKEHGELADVVKSKKLADVHHHAFAIRDLANGLPAKVAADKKARVEGSVKNIAKLAEDLDKTGDDNNQAGTESNLKKLDGVLMALEKQVK